DTMRIIQGPNGWPMAWEQEINGKKRKLFRDDFSGRSQCLHLKLFNPSDDLYGQSPIEAAANAIDIHNAGGAWNKALIDNAARPSGALVYKGANGYERLSDEQFERLKHELSMAHTGASNAGRPLLLEGGLEWSPMSLSPQEMDFVEARRQAARDIALSFGIAPMLLGIPGDNTYSNYKEANSAFWRQNILPLATKLANALSQFLSPWAMEKLNVSLDLENIQALVFERESLWARLENASFLSLEEKRKLAGLGK
ncbi:MAG: phage portal protein, partial [Caulobacterales bacterium]|nr:phage portal protein [Caulobacterales bacterium]